MPNRELLKSIQRRQKELRMESINPDKVQDVMRIKESYVRYEALKDFEKAMTELLAGMSSKIDQIDSKADTFSTETKQDVSGIIKNALDEIGLKIRLVKELDQKSLESFTESIFRLTEKFNSLKGSSKQQVIQTKEELSTKLESLGDAIRNEFSKKIVNIENELFHSIDEIETLKRQPVGDIPPGLIDKLKSLTVQKSLSIPVATDEGGLGTTIRPKLGQVPVGQSDGTYRPQDFSSSGGGGGGITKAEVLNYDFLLMGG